MRVSRRFETGAVLFLALIMLLLLNMLTAASISSSNISMQVIHSQQALADVQQVATNTSNYLISNLDHAINYQAYLDSEDNFSPVIPEVLAVRGSETFDIQVDSFVCLLERDVSGCSRGSEIPCPKESIWQLSITASNKTTGAQTSIVEGFSLTYLPGYCP